MAGMNLTDLLGAFVGLLLTLMVFSYILGDNILFRLAIHIFVGVSAGFVLVLAFYSVIWPHLIAPIMTSILSGNFAGILSFLIPLALSILLLLRSFPKLSVVGSPVMALLVGVGAAAAIGGAVLGTVFPQIESAIGNFDLTTAAQTETPLWLFFLNGGLILLGTVTTLTYFQFKASPDAQGTIRRAFWIEMLASVGKFFIAVTLGAVFAGALIASLGALVERMNFIVDFLFSLIS